MILFQQLPGGVGHLARHRLGARFGQTLWAAMSGKMPDATDEPICSLYWLRSQHRGIHSMSTVLRVGVIGLGRAGSGMITAMAKHPDIHVTAAADLYEAHRERFKEDFGGLAFDSVEGICASPD